MRRRVLLAAVVSLVLAALVVVVAALLVSRARRTPAAPPSPPATPEALRDAARETAVAYLQHLQDGAPEAAYRLLSAESRKRHSQQQFRRMAQQSVIYYDLASAQVRLVGSNRAQVTLQMENDPASATIHLLREQGAWRVVYRRGRPGMPYP